MMLRVPKPTPPLDLLRTLARFVKIHHAFNGCTCELLDICDTAPDRTKGDLAALLAERNLNTTAANLEILITWTAEVRRSWLVLVTPADDTKEKKPQ